MTDKVTNMLTKQDREFIKRHGVDEFEKEQEWREAREAQQREWEREHAEREREHAEWEAKREAESARISAETAALQALMDRADAERRKKYPERWAEEQAREALRQREIAELMDPEALAKYQRETERLIAKIENPPVEVADVLGVGLAESEWTAAEPEPSHAPPAKQRSGLVTEN